MSRIYDALKRAADQAKQREGPVAMAATKEPAMAPLDVPRPLEVETLLVRAPLGGLPPTPPLHPLQEGLELDSAERQEPEESPARRGPETYRDQVRRTLQARLALEREKMATEGKHLYEGRWLTVEQVRSLGRRLTWKTLGILFQLILLFVFMGFINVVLLWLLKFALPG